MLRRLAPLAVAITSLAVSVMIAHIVHRAHLTEQDRRLFAASERISQRMTDHALVLGALKGTMMTGRRIIDGEGITTFLSALPTMAGLGSAQGFGFALAFTPGQEMVAQALGARSYEAFPPPWPPSDLALRTAIIVLEPQNIRNQAALGFDMYSEPTRRDAMERALRLRGPAATTAVRLVQELDGPPHKGVLIYLPVFGSDGVAMPPGAGNDDLVGFVYTPIRVGALIETILAEAPRLAFMVEVHAGRPGPDTLISGSIPEGRRAVETMVRMADQDWTLRIADSEAQTILHSPATLVLLLGGLAALLLGMVVRVHLHEIEIEAKLAQETRKQAESRAILLGEMQHRIKNSIARNLALFRLSIRETSDRPALVAAYEERMQALAKAQDLLLNAPGRGVSIARLLADEVGAWRSVNPMIRLDGPEIILDGHQLQALALIFHELTTNSLKYGALAHGGPLSVTWGPEAGVVGGRRVILCWCEAVPPAGTDEANQGFGSRLIRLMAEGQLAGWSRRSLGNGVLEVTFGFPLAPPEDSEEAGD